MFSNELTLNVGSEATPIEKQFERINQDNYSSEYRLKDGDNIYVFRIRHQTEKNKLKGQVMERHNVTATLNIAPSDAYPQGQTFEAYTVIRCPPSASAAEVLGLATASCRFTLDQGAKLLLGVS